MAPRLSHTKSRNGCKRCKVRKVKCDEVHPTCNNCKRHGVECEYVNHFPQQAGAAPFPGTHRENGFDQSAGRHASLDLSIQTPYTDDEIYGMISNADDRRMLELRLLHHFTSVVSYSFPSSLISEMWRVDAVRLGFEHEFLMNTIFAMSALHLARDIPLSPRYHTKDEISLALAHILNLPKTSLGRIDPVMAHQFYLNLAVSQQRNALTNICAENSDALFLSSVLLSYQGLKMLPDGHNPTIEYTPPTAWLRMANAIRHVSDATIPFLESRYESDDYQCPGVFLASVSEPNFRDRAAIFNPEHSKPFASLLDWEQFPEPDLDEQSKSAYEQALYYIAGVYHALLDREDPGLIFRRLISLAPLVPTHFIALVEQGRPRALAILSLHCAMAKVVDDHWIFHGFAEREVYGIQSMLPQEWQWAMEWPLALLQQNSP
ncbi:hypothetical protein NA57DRAFT_52704 [Rhizodiscina lignyota]|uniref:Zn(2)-C6 fungal-type domain-containing protein n=1 Tax=Rhizodiscina lignyota TaxID=1504668 RepID=A0A9P4IP99_9PEZI|nr:hypothetical protein NA57DRAFT_52704 [Rhizodiscina lignyota]